jgi:hypothetical protein
MSMENAELERALRRALETWQHEATREDCTPEINAARVEGAAALVDTLALALLALEAVEIRRALRRLVRAPGEADPITAPADIVTGGAAPYRSRLVQLTQDETAEVIDRYRAGASEHELAQEYQATHTLIRSVLRGANALRDPERTGRRPGDA